jgi:hypothetical protein
MARKTKIEVPLTREEQIAEAFRKNHHAMDNCPECPDHCVIKVGDELEVGSLHNCIAVAVSPDNKFVCIEVHDKGLTYGRPYDNGRQIKGVWPWHSIRRTSDIQDTAFFDVTSGAKALERGHRSVSDIAGLVHGVIRRGFYADPLYQRGYVWTDADRTRLLDSLFRGLGIGEFIFLSHRDNGDYTYEVLDGQQRLTTLVNFMLNKFTYRGKLWNQLSPRDQQQFESVRVSWVEMEGTYLTPKLKAEIFLIVNDSGVPQTEEHLAKVREFLKTA